MATKHPWRSRLNIGTGCTRSPPKPGRRSNSLLRASQPSRALADLWLQRSASRSPPTSTAIRIPYTAVQAARSRCAMAACCWDGRDEDAAHKMVHAQCMLIRSSGRASRARPAAHGFASPTSRAENPVTKPSHDPDPVRLRRNGRSWQTARITKVTNRRQSPAHRDCTVAVVRRDPECPSVTEACALVPHPRPVGGGSRESKAQSVDSLESPRGFAI